jgi:hypothetical protein
MKKKAYSLITGIIFIISGVGKSFAITDFSYLIIQYGFDNLAFLAPIIAISEVLIGLLLIFQIQLKKTACLSLFLLVVFTTIYLYGYLGKDIEDCGCFGVLSVINLPPVWTFVRNGIIIYLLFEICRNKTEINFQTSYWANPIIMIVICIVSFVSGYTYFNELDIEDKNHEYAGKSIQQTPLNNFIHTSPDSTYLVFAFSYSCSHCLNSIENLKQYEKSGIVDKVIGLAWGDSISEKQMIENFNPDFSIQNCTPMTLFKLTNRFPTAYYIDKDTVNLILHGELPCSYVFSKKIKNK